MPYISNDTKMSLDEGRAVETAGELNFKITELCLEYINSQVVDPNYSIYNAVIGALECAKLEFYRRALVPYEEQKKFDNGDVGYEKLQPL